MRAPQVGPMTALALAAGLAVVTPSPVVAQWLDLSVPERPSSDAAMVDAGQAIYEESCWFCHGEDGEGEGPVAAYMWPRPRDFMTASYKLRTTASGELPTDEDLFRTITLGLPGTAMPEWGSTLTEDERWQVIAYIKSFAADLFEDDAFDPYQQIVELGEPPRESAAALVEAGRQVFEAADCWECHGIEGRGSGEKAPELLDDWDFPLWPANLRLGWKFKGGNTVKDIYARLTTGLDGSPMPSYSETLTDEERWQVAYYSASLQEGSDEDRSSVVVIEATRVDGEVPSDPGDEAWESAEEASIPLTGQATFAPRWQVPAVTDIAVRVLYSTEEVAIRLAWDDRFADTLSADPERTAAEGWTSDDTWPVLYPDGTRVRGVFPDAAEVMFPVRDAGPVLPHFVYGSSGQPVDLWRWQADLQHAPGSPSSVAELRAGGAQRPPEAHGVESQKATGSGQWEEGRWMVVVRRPLGTDDGSEEVQFQAGQYVPFALHVWDGANGETGLKMAISSWYFLYLREPTPLRSYLAVLLLVAIAFTLEVGVLRWMRTKADHGDLVALRVPASVVEADHEDI